MAWQLIDMQLSSQATKLDDTSALISILGPSLKNAGDGKPASILRFQLKGVYASYFGLDSTGTPAALVTDFAILDWPLRPR